MSAAVAKRLRLVALAAAACGLLALSLGAGSASAASAWWLLDSSTGPTNLVHGSKAIVLASAVNEGYTEASGAKKTIFITDTLPTGMKLAKIQSAEAGVYATFGDQHPIPLTCTVTESRVVRCPLEGVVFASEAIKLKLEVEVENTLETGAKNIVKVEGGEDGSGEELEEKKLEHELTVSNEPNKFGLENYELRPENDEGKPETQAGAHPFQLTSTVDLNELSETTLFFGGKEYLNPVPPDLTKNLHFMLPRGLIGNVANRPKCTEADFDTFFVGHVNNCRENTAIGVASVTLLEPISVGLFTAPVPVFNLVPSPGEPARFGFELYEVPVVLTTRVLNGSSYEVEVSVHYASEAANIEGSQVTFWGVPGDKRHDASRGWECIADGAYVSGVSPARPCKPSEEEHPTAFLSMPTSCEASAENLTSTVTGEAWQEGVTFGGLPSDEYKFTPFTGCGALPFNPSVEVIPDHSSAATPSGMEVNVNVPQATTLSGEKGALAEAGVRKTTLTLPSGIEASGGAANGLATCTTSAFGFDGGEPFGEESEGTLTSLTENDHYNTNEVECPDAAKVGTVTVETPLLEQDLEGSVYLGHIHTAPFQSPLYLFIVAEDKTAGVDVKLAGEVQMNPATGELTSVFKETPPLPFSSLKLHLFDGARATQSTPETCGVHEGAATFVPWSVEGNEEQRDAQAYHAPNPSVDVTSEPGGAPCDSSPTSQPFNPSFTAGSLNTQQGGAFAPFSVTIGRADGDQALKTISVTEPPGAAAMLANVPECPTAEAELPEPNCPAGSAIGESTAVAGLGTSHVTLHGTAYLTGPYHGAPFGLLDVTDATHVGPFDLGHIPVMSTITVNETTAQATVTSNPLPQFVKGVPSQIHEINVDVNRPEFAFNPTDCNELQGGYTLTGYGPAGNDAGVSKPFGYHAANCGALPFKPSISVHVESNYSRVDGTGMKIVVHSGKGQANIHLTHLVFPNSVPSRLTTIQKACPAATFAANPASCPEGSVIGSAIAHTPVLKSPLTGPAYLVSHANESFPDAVFVLQGEGIKLVLDGKTNIKNGVTSSTFESVPDAPVESFEVTLPRGPHSAFSGYGNLCEKPIEVPTTFGGQNGALLEGKTKVTVENCGKVLPTSKENELAKNLKYCKKAKKHSVRVKCEANARKRFKAIAVCKSKDKKSKSKRVKCEASARKKYALRLK